MKPQFDTLYASLEKSLNTLDRNLSGVDRYVQGIHLIQEKVLEVRALQKKFVTGRETEVEFFRTVWPAFWGKLLLYWQLYQFEKRRWSISPEGMPELISLEQRRVAPFFQSNQAFWICYRSGSPKLDEKFTRAYSRTWPLNPLSLLMDGEEATLASYRVARCLAMDAYRAWLAEEKEQLERPVRTGAEGRKKRYEWKETKSAAMELIKSQALAGSIYINGETATATQLKELWEETFEEELKAFNKLLYASDARKKDPMPYLTKLKNAFIGRKGRLGK